MTHQYRLVQWNKHKKMYDFVILAGIVLYVAGFFVISKVTWAANHSISDEVLIIRSFGTLSFLMLHIILCIGPLARLSTKFAPLLYNRRHLGVSMFLVGLIHGVLSLLYYHDFGVVDPLTSLLTSNTNYTSLAAFPFQVLGAVALLILFVMAATSHDFWLKNLSPGAWKTLHMLVYFAYGLLVMHVVLGALQSERSGIYPITVATGAIIVISLHIAAGVIQNTRDARATREAIGDGWLDVCAPNDIVDGRAMTVSTQSGEKIAVFRHGDKYSAVTSLCAHQHGPLGEGKIVDGCITCPWHGYQYQPHNGQSPPPFTEKIVTYAVRITDGRVLVNSIGKEPGTAIEPAVMETGI